MRRLFNWGATVLLGAALMGCAVPDTQSASSEAAPPPVYVAVEALMDVDWVVEKLEGVAMLQSPPPRLRWSSPDRVSGNGGCNQFTGMAALDKDRLTLGHLASTRMLCLPRPQGQEDKFFKALEQTRRVRLSEGALIFSDEENKTLLRLVKVSQR